MRATSVPIALIASLTVLAGACGTVDEAQQAIGDAASEVASDLETAADGTSTPGEEGGQATQTPADGEGGEPDSPPATEAPPAVTVDDLGRVGANGHAYLQAGVPELVIEIDTQEGVSVDDAALQHLTSTIESLVDKPAGVGIAGGNTFASDRTEWTADDLRAAAEANRDLQSSQDRVVLYLLYVRGGFHADGSETNALGVTYNASEIGMFPERWQSLGGLLGGGSQVERAVLVHEFGHALGLVNLTYDSEVDHEDAEHPGHSSNKSSVMYYAIETTLIGQVFSGPPPDTFDDADRSDIAGLRSGRY